MPTVHTAASGGRESITGGGAAHTRLVVALHADATPCTHSVAFLQSAHGAVPVTEYVEFTTHDGGAALHTRLFSRSQFEDIPWLQSLFSLHGRHGAVPVSDQVDRAMHAAGGLLHTRSVVASHADAIPYSQSTAFWQSAHGAVPAVDQVKFVTQFSTSQQAFRSSVTVDGEQMAPTHSNAPLVSLIL